MSSRTGRDAVTFLARGELRSRWREITVIGVVCGLAAAVVLATITVLWRTESAYDRLVAAADLDDVRVSVFTASSKPEQSTDAHVAAERTVDALRGSPGVSGATDVSAYVGKVRGPGIVYLSVAAPSALDGVARPVVVRGRVADPNDPREVVIAESLARGLGLGPGDRLTLDLLTSRQFVRFSTGFGRPAGGAAPLRIVGVFRFPGTSSAYNAIVATPAFARAHPDTFAHFLMMRSTDPPRVVRAAAARDRVMSARFGVGPMAWVSAETPRDLPDPDLAPTLAVLRAGLIALLVVLLAAGLLLVGQLCGRWAELTRGAQQVERALGMTTRDRTAARVLAGGPGALLTGVLAAAGALVGGLVEPLGSISRYEPDPGWLPRPSIAVVGGVAAFLVVTAGTAATVARAGRARRTRDTGRTARTGLRPVPLALALARSRGSAATTLPVRSMIAGVAVLAAVSVVIVGVHLRVAGIADRPADFGWRADFGLVDDTPDLDRRVVADERVRDAEQVTTGPVSIASGGATRSAYGYGRRTLRGALPWTLAGGRIPTRTGEIALGPRLAQEWGIQRGDTVEGRTAAGRRIPLRVVGIVVIPVSGREALGTNVLMTATQLRRLVAGPPYSTLLVRGTTDAAGDALRARFALDREISTPTAPPGVAALDELGTPTLLLLGVLALAFAVLLVQNARLLARRRRSQLAVVAAMGVPRTRVAASVLATLALLTVPALGVGALLGWLVCRIVLIEAGPRLGLVLPGPGWAGIVWPLAAGSGLALSVAVVLALAVTRARRGTATTSF